jgi:hypothetical protein
LSAPHLDWEKGGTARIVAIAKDAVTLRSSVPSPPGSRVTGVLRESGEKVRLKIHSSKKQEGAEADEAFLLEGRAIDLTRSMREHLEALARASP